MAVFAWATRRSTRTTSRTSQRDRIEYDLVRYYRKGNAYLENASDAEVEAAEAEIESIMQGPRGGRRQGLRAKSRRSSIRCSAA